jgi:hypothetical protein
MDFMALLQNFGPLVGIILFFIWRDWKREEDLVNRVATLEKFNQDTMAAMVKESTAVIATNTEQLRILNTSIAERKDG